MTELRSLPSQLVNSFRYVPNTFQFAMWLKKTHDAERVQPDSTIMGDKCQLLLLSLLLLLLTRKEKKKMLWIRETKDQKLLLLFEESSSCIQVNSTATIMPKK